MVPCNDLKQKRRYDLEYSRPHRAQQDLTSRGQTPLHEASICLKFPQLRLLPGIVFHDGCFVTNDPQQQALVEQNLEYGKHIFSWRLEP
jgi:hypothetical protein